MNYPKVIIERASPVYEANLLKVPGYIMPEDSVYEEKISQLKKDWDEWGQKIFAKLQEVTKLEWRDSDIRCYIVSGTRASFSHPFTLKFYDTSEKMFDTFVHELLHRLLHSPEHPERIREARKKLIEPYQNESTPTKNHIVLHALHAQLTLELFGEEHMNRIANAARSHDYVRAWEIVRELGRENILEKMYGYKVPKNII